MTLYYLYLIVGSPLIIIPFQSLIFEYLKLLLFGPCEFRRAPLNPETWIRQFCCSLEMWQFIGIYIFVTLEITRIVQMQNQQHFVIIIEKVPEP